MVEAIAVEYNVESNKHPFHFLNEITGMCFLQDIIGFKEKKLEKNTYLIFTFYLQESIYK